MGEEGGQIGGRKNENESMMTCTLVCKVVYR